MIGYQQKLARVLDRMGGLYTLDDILTRIADGRMQSHVEGNSWAVTELGVFPRAKKLTIVACVGDMAQCEILHDRVLAYADDVNAGLVSAYGRKGWIPQAQEHGWKLKTRNWLWHKEL